ncbi:hypothetical protein AAVH_25620 [Aphelenchoides avenae]|nr:hypothetical protein AAVH_25620 [Aphelenchus avenae]
MYRTIGRKTAISTVTVSIPEDSQPDTRLLHLIEHFPSVKGAVRLDMWFIWSALPTDAALDHFERLQTIVIHTDCFHEKPSFWSNLFAIKAFRRVANFITLDRERENLKEVDDAALFDFITDFSLMPPDKPRVVSLGRPLTDDSINALKRRFKKNTASIGGQVCAIVLGPDNDRRYLTNMTSGSRKKPLAKQLLLSAYRVKP